jgi:hypothetical protein
VHLDGHFADHKRSGDLLVAAALTNEVIHFLLAWREGIGTATSGPSLHLKSGGCASSLVSGLRENASENGSVDSFSHEFFEHPGVKPIGKDECVGEPCRDSARKLGPYEFPARGLVECESVEDPGPPPERSRLQFLAQFFGMLEEFGCFI